MNKSKFHLVSLGCSKNTVDSESISQILINNNFNSTTSPEQADILIVNTCGFIGPAKEESYSVLESLAQNKQPNQFLIAAGCLTQRYGEEVVKRVKGIDGILGTRRWMDIMEVVQNVRTSSKKTPYYHLPTDANTVGVDEKDTLRVSNNGPSAYIKIADGCRRPCAFCAIPLIKGTAVSRPLESILNEAIFLQSQNTKEINLIAQDTTDYGHDLGIKNGLAKLIKEISNSAPEVNWIRLLYAYPGYVTDELIEEMAINPNFIPYLDMPLQHAHPMTLRRMKRPANVDWVYKTLEKLKNNIPEISLRTTFIVGYPGETEDEFQTLVDFIKEIRFDRVGVFTFSFEPGTTSEPLGDPIPDEVKNERQKQLMSIQQQISLENNQKMIGSTYDVLIEGYGETEDTKEPISIGRTYRDAPEIDGMVFIDSHAPVGEIIPVKINGALPYDLTGTIETNKIIINMDE